MQVTGMFFLVFEWLNVSAIKEARLVCRDWDQMIRARVTELFASGIRSGLEKLLAEFHLEKLAKDEHAIQISPRGRAEIYPEFLTSRQTLVDLTAQCSRFPSLASIQFGDGCQIPSDAWLSNLGKAAPKLTSLNLGTCSGFTGEGLASFQHLTYLDLVGCQDITDKGAECVSKMVTLHALCMSLNVNRGLSGTFLSQLVDLSCLKELNFLYNDGLTNEGMVTLSNLTALRRLELTWMEFDEEVEFTTPDCWKPLAKKNQLEKLSIDDGCGNTALLGPQGFELLGNMNRLRELHLDINEEVGLSQLGHLAKLPHLAILRFEQILFLDTKCMQLVGSFPALVELTGSLRVQEHDLQWLGVLSSLRKLEVRCEKEISPQTWKDLVGAILTAASLEGHYTVKVSEHTPLRQKALRLKASQLTIFPHAQNK